MEPLSVTQHVVILAILGLLGAYQRGDRAAVAHHGAHSSVLALSQALAAPERGDRLAAIQAATSAGHDAWVLLAPLAERARERDRPVAAAAARAAVRIAERIDRRRALEWDIPVDDLLDRLVAWRELARDGGSWPDVRVHAMETAAHLYAALGDDASEAPFDLVSALADPEPEVRRAALELSPMPLPDELLATVVARVTADGDATVALVAAQTACTAIALDAEAAPILAALGDAGLARLRELVVEPAAPPAAVIDAARCLAADPNPLSKTVLRSLRLERKRQ
jgi:hypothetical protein